MIFPKVKSIFYLFSLVLLFLACISKTKPQNQKDIPDPKTGEVQTPQQTARLSYRIPHDVKVKKYFRFMDTLVAHLDTLVPYRLTEHLLVRANPRLIDTLAVTERQICAMSFLIFVETVFTGWPKISRMSTTYRFLRAFWLLPPHPKYPISSPLAPSS